MDLRIGDGLQSVAGQLDPESPQRRLSRGTVGRVVAPDDETDYSDHQEVLWHE